MKFIVVILSLFSGFSVSAAERGCEGTVLEAMQARLSAERSCKEVVLEAVQGRLLANEAIDQTQVNQTSKQTWEVVSYPRVSGGETVIWFIVTNPSGHSCQIASIRAEDLHGNELPWR